MKSKLTIFATVALCVSFICSCDSGNDPKFSSENEIKSFIISNLNPQITGVINQSAKTVTVSVPYNTNLTTLVPIITTSEKSTVSPISAVVQDFTNPVLYMVTAEDKSTAVYTVTVKRLDATTETLSGTMNANRTLPDLGLPVDYVIDGIFYVDGNALLTIEPGVKILFTGIDGAIDVGENAGLKMVGTADKPIEFGGPLNNPNKGSWSSIRYHSKRTDNLMEYVRLINGGSDENDWRGVLRVSGSVSVKNCEINGSLGAGIQVDADASLKTFDGNTVKNCNYYAMWIDNLTAATAITSSNIFTDNVKNVVRIQGSVSNSDLTLKAIQIPYLMQDIVYVEKKLTLEAGVSLYFQQSATMRIEASGQIIAAGTTDKHIVIRGLNNEAGYWGGIMLSSTVSGNKLIYCDISGGGLSDAWNSNSNLYLRSSAKITIQNCTFSRSNFYGVTVEDKSNANFQLVQSGNSFSSCRLGNVYDEATEVVLNSLP
ncbi:MAG: DUF5018 domain-containing protein [Paludibacteraceae bacterium]